MLRNKQKTEKQYKENMCKPSPQTEANSINKKKKVNRIEFRK